MMKRALVDQPVTAEEFEIIFNAQGEDFTQKQLEELSKLNGEAAKRKKYEFAQKISQLQADAAAKRQKV